MYGKRLRELRKQSKLSQGEFAKRYGTAASTISGYEREITEPPYEFLQRVANDYGISVDSILGNETQTDYRTLIADSYDDYADFISMGYTPEEAEKMLTEEIQKYGKLILRLHYYDRRKVEQYVKELRESGEYD